MDETEKLFKTLLKPDQRAAHDAALAAEKSKVLGEAKKVARCVQCTKPLDVVGSTKCSRCGGKPAVTKQIGTVKASDSRLQPPPQGHAKTHFPPPAGVIPSAWKTTESKRTSETSELKQASEPKRTSEPQGWNNSQALLFARDSAPPISTSRTAAPESNTQHKNGNVLPSSGTMALNDTLASKEQRNTLDAKAKDQTKPDEKKVWSAVDTQRLKWLNQSRLRKTKRGAVIKDVRGRLLRKDITCKSPLCTVARCQGLGKGGVNVGLSGLTADISTYLLPDSDTVRRFFDIFQLSNWRNVIILRSVFSELTFTDKMRKIISDPKRHFVLFEDENFEETVAVKEKHEDSVSVVAEWFSAHWNQKDITLVVLSENETVVQSLSSTRGVQVVSMGAYLVQTQASSNMQELYRSVLDTEEALRKDLLERKAALLAAGDEVQPRARSVLFPEHISEGKMWSGLNEKEYFRVFLRTSRYFPSFEAVGKLSSDSRISKLTGKFAIGGEESTDSVLLHGSLNRNRALDGDEVVIEILPRSEWKAYMSKRKLVAPSENEEDTTQEAMLAEESKVPSGRVVAIIQRRWRPLVCTVQLEDRERRGHVLCVPMDIRFPKIRIATKQDLSQDRILVNIDQWEADSKYPAGHYVKRIGPLDDIETGIQCILVERLISHPDFTPQQREVLPVRVLPKGLTQAQTYAWTIPPEALVGRRDLRKDTLVCSIDPIGCEDIDDAMSVRDRGDGTFEVGVHIADVTYFVPADSKLDLEARARATSVYLADRRLDMLPEVLSTDLCSLRGGTERLAVSVMWVMDSKFNILDTWFGRTAIFNSYSMTYEDAQAICDFDFAKFEQLSEPKDMKSPTRGELLLHSFGLTSIEPMNRKQAENLQSPLRLMLKIARKLKQDRLDMGALVLESFELQFELDASKAPTKIKEEAHIEFHSVVEELMVQANKSVAEKLYSRFPTCALLRKHEAPPQQAFTDLKELALTLGLHLDTSTNRALAQSLDKAELELDKTRKAMHANNSSSKQLQQAEEEGRQRQAEVIKILRTMTSSAMQEAQYLSTGQCPKEKFFHYGLSAAFYTHFTSPIRRYADVIVHRQLLALVEVERQDGRTSSGPVSKTRGVVKASQLISTDGWICDKCQTLNEVLKTRCIKCETRKPAPAAASDARSSSHEARPKSLAIEVVSTAPSFFNDTDVQNMAEICNVRHREADRAGEESQLLFLAWFLSTPVESKDSGPTKKERKLVARQGGKRLRVDAVVTGLRDNGLIVTVPAIRSRGPVLLRDREGLAPLSHPVEGAEVPTRPPCSLVWNQLKNSVKLTLTQPLASNVDLLTREIKIFDRIHVDVFLPLQFSRYRIPSPTYQLVWEASNSSTFLHSGMNLELFAQPKPIATSTCLTHIEEALSLAKKNQAGIYWLIEMMSMRAETVSNSTKKGPIFKVEKEEQVSEQVAPSLSESSISRNQKRRHARAIKGRTELRAAEMPRLKIATRLRFDPAKQVET